MIWVILGGGFVLRLISLNQSLWFDEGINVMAAKNFSFIGMLTQYAIADFHPPAWFVTLWIWAKLFGYAEIAVRLPSVVFGVLTVYITYLIGKKLVSKKPGLVAALLLAINPLHIYYSQEARMYALATLAVAVNMLLFIKIIKKEKINLIFIILSNLIVLLSDYLAYFIFPSQLIFLILWRREFIKKWIIAQVLAVLLFTLWLPVFFKQLDIGGSLSSNLPTWKFVVGGFDFKTIPLTFVKFVIGRISLANKLLYGVLLFPVIILFAYLLIRGSRKLLLLWLLVPIIIATIISFFIPVYSYFRVLYILPAFLILISLGILSLKTFRLSALVVVLSIEIISSFIYLTNPNYQREDWRSVVNFLENKKDSVILFESSGTFPVFDYYAKGALNAKGSLKDFPAKDESAVAEIDNNYREVYLVDYLVEISDPKRFVAKKLTDLGYNIIDTTDFHGVGFVYHYAKKD